MRGVKRRGDPSPPSRFPCHSEPVTDVTGSGIRIFPPRPQGARASGEGVFRAPARATFARGGQWSEAEQMPLGYKSSQKHRQKLRFCTSSARYARPLCGGCPRVHGFSLSLSVRRTVPGQLTAAASLTLPPAAVGVIPSTALCRTRVSLSVGRGDHPHPQASLV